MESVEGIAHTLNLNERTDDVRFKEFTPFSKMLLKNCVHKGLNNQGYLYPTVVQAAAIPVGKSGLDLLVQSKAGTGKTLIFATILLEAYCSNVHFPQSLIVAPTREIAVQIEHVLNQIGRSCVGFRAVSVIGGLDVADDRKRLQGARAIVGTPGRILHLIQNDVLNTSQIKLFVMDEADKMYTQSFRQDMHRIQKALPAKRQTIACSATFCNNLDTELAKIMHNPLLISTDDRATLLIGIKQYVIELPEQKTSILEMQAKIETLRDIFRRIAFKQCMIFAGSQLRADSYRNYLEKEGWPCELMSGAQDQKLRLEMFKKFREFKTRILIATDLMSRGIDSEYVNLVINLEGPSDAVTYLHRIGRAGRFGSHGIAISIVSSAKEHCTFKRIIAKVGIGLNVMKFPTIDKVEYNFWDFSDFKAEAKYCGVYGDEQLAPLASQEDAASASNSEETTDNSTENVVETNSSIDTQTFRIDSKDSALNLVDSFMERPHEHFVEDQKKLTPDSRQSSSQQLPSSNTIDDASSLAADSLRSSQQDVSRHQSMLVQKTSLPTLVDQKPAGDDIANVGKKPSIVDIFDDYKKSVLDKADTSLTESEDELHLSANTLAKFQSLLIDKPTPKPQKNNIGNLYSDYTNFICEEDSNSISQAPASETETHDIDKGTFILSVATPTNVHDSIEELQNSSLDFSQYASTDTGTCPSPAQVKHYPSPTNEQMPMKWEPVVGEQQQQASRLSLLSPTHLKLQKLTVNVREQIKIAPYESQNSPSSANAVGSPSNAPSLDEFVDDEELNVTGSSTISVGSGSDGGGDGVGNSSGFDEKSTTSRSSGIETSEKEDTEAYQTSSSDDDSYTASVELEDNDAMRQNPQAVWTAMYREQFMFIQDSLKLARFRRNYQQQKAQQQE